MIQLNINRTLVAMIMALLLPATLLAGLPDSYKPGPRVITAGEAGTQPGNVIVDLDYSLGYLWAATSKGLGRFLSANQSDDPTAGAWTNFGADKGFLGRGGLAAVTGATTSAGSFILASTSIDSVIDGEVFPTGTGIGYSTDLGQNWTWFQQPIDPRDETGFEPTTTPVLNVTYDLAMQGSRVWAASFAGGLRYYDVSDPNTGWVVRPPDTEPFDAAGSRNHLAVSVTANDSLLLVGTSSGLNISRDGGDTWINHDFSAQNENTLSGNWITGVELQPHAGGAVSIWAISRSTDVSGEYGAISVSDDLGATWRRLIGTPDDPLIAHNIFIQDSTVYVATNDGLYKTEDNGETWGLYGPVYDEESEEFTWYSEVYATAAENGRIWRGSPEGLAVTNDGGLNWRLMRVHAPVGISGAPDVYAYPNPFSPNRHEIVRIRYSMESAGDVTVEVYDFAMELLIRPVKGRSRPAGEHNEVWDGRGPGGTTVANGVYFVRVVGGGTDVWTKILLLD